MKKYQITIEYNDGEKYSEYFTCAHMHQVTDHVNVVAVNTTVPIVSFNIVEIGDVLMSNEELIAFCKRAQEVHRELLRTEGAHDWSPKHAVKLSRCICDLHSFLTNAWTLFTDEDDE